MTQIHIQSETYLDFLQLRSGYFDGVTALISGALFALLFVVLWESNALNAVLGSVVSENLIKIILPKQVEMSNNLTCPNTVADLFFCIHVTDIHDFAKLLIISFFAGFAEKLIPDAIDRVTEKAVQSKSGADPGSAA